MPAQVQGNRTQIAQGIYPKLSPGAEIVYIESKNAGGELADWTHVPEEIVSSVLGAISGESIAENPPNRRGPITYVFDPPRLRSSYAVQFLTVNLPALTLILLKAKAVANVIEGEVEVGWLVGVNIGGVVTYSEPITATLKALAHTLEKGGLPVQAPAIQKQLQFTADLTVLPGITFQVEAIPFVRFIKMSVEGGGPTTFGARLKTEEPTGTNPPTSAVVTYSQTSSR